MSSTVLIQLLNRLRFNGENYTHDTYNSTDMLRVMCDMYNNKYDYYFDLKLPYMFTVLLVHTAYLYHFSVSQYTIIGKIRNAPQINLSNPNMCGI